MPWPPEATPRLRSSCSAIWGKRKRPSSGPTLDGLARGRFDPLSVVVLLGHDRPAHAAPLSWGLPESAVQPPQRHDHQGRSAARSRWASWRSPSPGCCGTSAPGQVRSRSNAPGLRPALRVIAVERNAEDAARIRTNAQRHGVVIEVVCGHTPESLLDLPDPDRVFVGGGGLDVLDAALPRLRSGGVLVATYALMERAGEAQKRLGNLVQISVARGVPTGGLGTRLSAENPVFICWGPDSADGVTPSVSAGDPPG